MNLSSDVTASDLVFLGRDVPREGLGGPPVADPPGGPQGFGIPYSDPLPLQFAVLGHVTEIYRIS